MLNREIFKTDPTSFVIPNDGVATVGAPEDEGQWNVLYYELQSFVCEGEYRRGLERILSIYLANLAQDKQPAVWISGFYGSGKSHLVRALEHFWRNVTFPDGTEARNLSKLPPELTDHLRELTTAGNRHGGLWAAAGRLSNGADSIRLDMLRIVLQAARLPADYAQARFVLWLMKEGVYDDVRRDVESGGVSFAEELRHLYVSPVLARALLRHLPDLAENQTQAREFLKAQYPRRTEITNEELVDTVREVLESQSSKPGQLPCTLLVFDEMQQAIGENTARALEVQSIVEDLSSRFRANVLVVATGQSAISATPQLQKLQGRFTVRVELSDRDVETVVREVVLRKDPRKLADLRSALDNVSGEIDRQLTGTRIGPVAADKEVLAADYPLLPTRRRFWEQVLRAIDTGASSQLRTQLQTVHQAARAVADKPVGTVVGADFIYGQQKAAMLPNGVLMTDIAAIIEKADDGTPDGRLKTRLCATVFLINKLPSTGGLATGLRADADTLADLLIEDLRGDGPEMRRRVPLLLAELERDNTLMAVDGAYTLQTTEGREWEGARQAHFNRIRNDSTRIADDRAEALKGAVQEDLRAKVRLIHGANKVARKFETYFGQEQPPANSPVVPIWVRDEWSVTEKSVRDEAQSAGTGSPIVFVFLPRSRAEELTHALAGAGAAAAVLAERYGRQATAEGEEAKGAMESHHRVEKGRVKEIAAEVWQGARVFQGGGNEIVADTPADAVQRAAEHALARLFTEFRMTDVPGWDQVVRRASAGAADALSAVGFGGNTADYPAARQIMDFIGAAGQKGSDVRARFTGVGYGWPQDAVDGILLALLNAGSASATGRSGEAVTARQIPQSSIGVTTFRREQNVLTMAQRIDLRAFAHDLTIKANPNEEAAAVERALQHLRETAASAAGGPPLPPLPDLSRVDTLQAYAGNEKLIRVHDARAELAVDYRRWQTLAGKKDDRLGRWRLLEQLLPHAAALPGATDWRDQMDAIRRDRTLLDDPDPVKPLLDAVTGGLREALLAARAAVEETLQRELAAIQATPEWDSLPDDKWRIILTSHKLGPIEPLDVGTDEKLLAALNARSVAAWETELEAIPTRVRASRLDAAKRLEPQAARVRPPSRTLKTTADVDAYLTDLRAEIMTHIDDNRPVIITLT